MIWYEVWSVGVKVFAALTFFNIGEADTLSQLSTLVKRKFFYIKKFSIPPTSLKM